MPGLEWLNKDAIYDLKHGYGIFEEQGGGTGDMDGSGVQARDNWSYGDSGWSV